MKWKRTKKGPKEQVDGKDEDDEANKLEIDEDTSDAEDELNIEVDSPEIEPQSPPQLEIKAEIEYCSKSLPAHPLPAGHAQLLERPGQLLHRPAELQPRLHSTLPHHHLLHNHFNIQHFRDSQSQREITDS